jgi:NAD(P)-dependent dehydrogenase (short-subunit alcohol dehydrogenase family)
MAKGTLLITGANGGLGTAIVSKFLKSPYAKDYKALLTVRNPATAHHLQAITKQATAPKSFEILPLDLSSLANIRTLAADVNSRVANGTLEPIRALVLNAAWQEATDECLTAQTFTKDSYEGAFGINYLANFLFALSILQSMDKEHGRIVMISSASHDSDHTRNPSAWFPKKYKVMFTDTESLAKGVAYADGKGWEAGMRRYGASKLCLVMFM